MEEVACFSLAHKRLPFISQWKNRVSFTYKNNNYFEGDFFNPPKLIIKKKWKIFTQKGMLKFFFVFLIIDKFFFHFVFLFFEKFIYWKFIYFFWTMKKMKYRGIIDSVYLFQAFFFDLLFYFVTFLE